MSGELYPGALAGYRAFRLFCGRLYSLTRSSLGSHFEYQEGTSRAHCTRVEHRAPDRECACGFWAYKDLEALLCEPLCFPQHDEWSPTQLVNVPIILSLVAAWGKIVEDEFGFRSEYLKPLVVVKTTALIPGYLDGSYEYRFEAHGLPLESVDKRGIDAVIRDYKLTSLQRERAREGTS